MYVFVEREKKKIKVTSSWGIWFVVEQRGGATENLRRRVEKNLGLEKGGGEEE